MIPVMQSYFTDRMVENKPIGRIDVQTRQVEEKTQRIQLILDAALIMFAEKGYAETSMADIAHAARLGKATLYYYFPTKEALYQEVYIVGTDAYYSAMMPALVDDPSGQFIRTMLRFYVEYMDSHRNFLKIFFPLGRSAPIRIIDSTPVQELQQRHRAQLNAILQDKLQGVNPDQREHILQVLWTFLTGLNSKLLRLVPLVNLMEEIETINRFMSQFLQE